MKHTIISQGYRLTVTSWENDADNYNTEVIEGLDLNLAKFYAELCKLMSYIPNTENKLNNLYEPSEKEVKAVKSAIKPIIKKFQIAPELGDEMDHLDKLGLSGTSEFFTRVCESYKVEYLPVDIILSDVTEDFQ